MSRAGEGAPSGDAARRRPVRIALALLAAVVAATLVMAFGVRPVRVAGASMAPRLQDGDVLLVLVTPGSPTLVREGDVVLASVRGTLGGRARVVKSVRAVTRRSDGSGWVELEGENVGTSRDSRRYGRVPLDDVRGVALLRIYPLPPSRLRDGPAPSAAGGSAGADPAGL